MAKDDTNDALEREIARGDDSVVEPKRRKKRDPVYRMIGNTKVPVSKAHGRVWKSRRDQAQSSRARRKLDESWDENIRYYRNDQSSHRYDHDDDAEYAGNESAAMHMGRRFSETENIVFANTSALVPSLYAKNPTVEFTENDAEDGEMAVLLEKLVARVMAKKTSPGVNLKPKVRKSVVMTTLTNAAYVEVGYTFREASSEQAMEDIAALSQQLQKAKNPQQVETIEGKIMALEETVDVLRPAGPFVKFRRPQDVLVDPDSVEDDHSDARWIMVADYINTAYLNARFAQRDGQNLVSVYKPTHVVLRGDGNGGSGHNTAEMEINQYSLLDDSDKDGAKAYGYNDEDSYRKAQRTKCWWVWDKTTMRCMLYTDKDWEWPVWVWDDPYQLQGFFPLYKLQFYTDPEEPTGRSEVSYYLDQQDAVNTINSELKQARQWARRNLFYDKNRISKDEVEKFIKGDEDVCVGVDVPEGMNLRDFVQSVVPPSMQFIQLFDKEPILAAIDRVASVQPVMRGIEFKTNTTNQAINTYNSIQQTRLDEKIDAVEDFIGQIGWALAQLCLIHMDQATVASLIGEKSSASWRNMSAGDIATNLQMTVVGGSTQKPTAESKKQQALQMGQVLGQFVNAAPAPVLLVMLQTMRSAFNDTIPDEQWQIIMEAIESAGGSGEAGTPVAAPSGGGGESAGQGAATPAQQGDPIAAIEQVFEALPDEAKQALGMAVARGVPIREAVTRVMEMVQGSAEPPQQREA